MNNSELNSTTNNTAFQQNLDNLPDELLAQPRFFEVGADKNPHVADWGNPANQHCYKDVDGIAGFDTVGHGLGDDYILFDFDHVLDEHGNFVNKAAEQWFNYCAAFESYCESSISGRGFHTLMKPTPNKFSPISNGKHGVLWFDKAKDAKLEIFYLSKARYCLVTGNVFGCNPKTPIVAGEVADECLQAILKEIAKQNPPTEKPARRPATEKNSSRLGDDYDLFRAEKMLDVINPADLEDSDWLAVNSACKNIGVPYHVVDAFNLRDPNRYDAAENQKRWDSVTDPDFGIETLHGIAKRFDYSEADSQREWYKLHPELSSAKKDTPSRRADLKSRLEYLNSLPQTPERDADIINTIREMLEWKLNRKGERLYPLPTFANMKLIFDNDPNLQSLVGYDEFQDADVFLKQAAWRRADCINAEWIDKDDAQLRLYIREHYDDLQGKQLIEDAIVRYSQAHSFNAVKNYFANLPEWDKVPRAETLFIKFLRVEDTPFAREVTMNWLLAAVARIFHPGCRYQTALVLHGNQKIGKSYIIERLGGAWYMELTDNVDDSHASDAIKKGWLIELKEMAAMRKSEINATKAFIERSFETRRAAYERRATTTYRHCVFVITVNDSEFLRDATGNRRYLILHCNSSMFDYVEGLTDEYIQQIWAEVYYQFNEMFKDGFDEKKLSLSRATEIKAEEVATHYLQDDGMASEIKGYLDKKIPPQVVWQLMTKDERRKFHVNSEFIITQEDLYSRLRSKGGKNLDDDLKALDDITADDSKDGDIRKIELKQRGSFTLPDGVDPPTVPAWKFYGSEYRQHICAAEIFNECFGSDKRKAMYRIGEILATLEGWHEGARLQKVDSVYRDQKKVYYRNDDNCPSKEIETPAQEKISSHESVDPDDLPF